MSTPTQESTPKIIKICPGCAIAHMANCQKVKGGETDDQEVVAPNKHSRLEHGLSVCKRTCGVTDDVTLWVLMSMMLELIATCSSALKSLAFAMLPVFKYFALLLLYLVDGILCVLDEKRPIYKGLKGAVLAASFIVLAYFAYTLLTTFVIPTFSLFKAIFSRTLSTF